MDQSERIERAAFQALHDGATADMAAVIGLASIDSGCLFACIATKLPSSAIVINRALGLGLDGPATLEAVRDVVKAYRDAQVARYFVQVHPDAEPAELRQWLTDAGLTRARGWQKFDRDGTPAPAVQTDLQVRKIGPDQGQSFATIVCNAFDIGEVAIPWLARLPSQPGWHAFMSFDGDQPAGTGALFIRDGVAWSDFGATAPEFRRRGSQGALLTHRINFAIGEGCERIYTCTGEDVAGDPQHSYRNILRMGFRTTYVRENYAPVP
jgi:GNAT superfamily N-acetyltransferase